MRVLVTGGAGFVGAVVIPRLLCAGHEVRTVDALLYGGSPLLGAIGACDVVVGDLREPAVRARALADADAVVHLAAIVGDPACKRRPESAWSINHDASVALAEEAALRGAGRFVFVSTCSNYGVSSPDAFVDEDSPLNPVSLYAESKVAAEKAILETGGSRFDPVVLRFATLYGASPRMRFDLLVNDFTRAAFVERKIVVYGETFWRPHLHVRDAARAIVAVLEAPPDTTRPRVFNVGDTRENYQKEAIARVAAEEVGGAEIEHVVRENDPRSYRVRFDRIRDAFGWSIERTVKDGAREVRALLEDAIITDHEHARYQN